MDFGNDAPVRGDILLIDDEMPNLRILMDLLTAEGYEMRGAPDGPTALMIVENESPELILLDIRMPEMDGYEVCKRLKANKSHRHIPVIFLSGLQETDEKVKGFEAGAVDFITKPFQAEEVLVRVNTHLTLSRLRQSLEQQVEKRTAELKESEECYHSIVEASPASIMTIRNGCFVFVNPAGARMLGFSDPDEMIGKPVIDVVAPESQQLVTERIKRLESGKDNPTVEIELIRQDEMRIMVESTSVSIPIGGIPSAVIIAQDITERGRAEQAIAEQLAFERLIADIAANLAHTGPEQLEEAIDSTLRSLGRFLNTERAFLAQFSSDGKSLQNTNIWTAEGLSVPPSLFELEIVADIPWVAQHIRNGGVINAGPGLAGLPDEARELRNWLERDGINSGVVVPVRVEVESIGMLGLDTVVQPREYPQSIVDRLRIVADMIGTTLRRIQAQAALRDSLNQVKQLKDRIEQENIYLREEIELQHKHGEIIGKSKAIRQMLRQAEQVAGTDSTVLILGETGTGKELLARAIHRMSSRKDRPMIIINCAALPTTLIESEMFGREKGAFTGALSGRVGRFEIADGSTIFLDEIGELTPEVQMKLLRVLENGQFERLGSNKTIKVDVRIIAATNRDLVKALHEGSFRRDLFYRLNVFPITVPPLRDRIEDIEMLVWVFVKESGDRMGKRIENIPRKSLETLQKFPWLGNVRELRNMIEQSMITTTGTTLNLQLPGPAEAATIQNVSLKDVELNHIQTILKQTGWRIRGKNGAAELLGLKPTTLDSRIKKLGIVRPK